ncbi:Uncharacterized protein ALO36_01541 [Pseudomonas syringae pv. tomato]|uniref:Uncharacterized protein n=1 Tax=Pseudomonas orientalis TaxID=76758 RepID=A0A1H2EAD8_9PSED|nr:hypothetical protein WX98_17885 [Pseudomonas syringae pv. persicae]KPY93711.1 Uncharacterized protein ALO36_01541 [Pseudomonas syringae pv. tomato]KRP66961.1 hypothetical protein TU82_07555 [Pseudomonas orientalis]SDT92070.1 hypothetical protein SAMN04490197_0919 [Pseudomonas orientalis]
MIGVFRDYPLGQQACRWDTFVDDLGWHRCLGQCFALIANPLTPNVPFNAEHARRVVEFLADILADALEGAAALALSVFRFVMNQRARKFGRQGDTFGLLTD